ncbi:MAG TPA: GH3 auxin-responsive promoter family protein [Sandaracinaceae bacterium LLY-WYZ-13_1]|nr:GH3 auxin-responsive promoter family protein [Sandaracinaceae bacterium LLY-WYZ-13_1]
MQSTETERQPGAARRAPADRERAARPVDPARPLKKTIYPPVVGQAFNMTARARVALWDRALRRVREVQEAQLLRFVKHAADTEFGKRYGFGTIHRYEDYRARVPVGDYDSFAPAIERMRAGERNVLVPELIKYFGNSSGSSNKGKQKFLPISDRQVKFQRGSAADALYRYLVWRGERDFTSGFTLGLFPPTTMKRSGPTWVTTNPSLQSIKMPAFAKPAQLPSKEIREIDDYDVKLDRIVDAYFDHDIRAVAGTTCWFSLLFDKLLEKARDKGYRVDSVREIWPNLRVLVGGGVSADPYLPVIRERMGRDDVVLVDTYNATEGGIFATSDHSGQPGMLVVPDRGVFFELVPVEEVDDPWPSRVPLWEVEPDRLYAIHVTTPSGLYSYRLGDLVRFPSVDPLRMEFAGRLSGCLSTTQELTTHVEIQRSVEAALEATGTTSVEFGAAADVGVEGTARSRYVVFVEFAGEPPTDREAFVDAFDAELQQQNRVYREHRDGDIAILRPELVVLPRGSVRRFMADIGNHSVQTKFPRILDDERKEILRSYVRA